MRAEYELLRGVSRSFYLSIRALPRPLRKPIAIAYLLARTSDTIADASTADADERVQLLDKFAALIADEARGNAKEPGKILGSDLTSSADLSARERQLLGSVDRLFDGLRALDEADRADVAALLAIITRGQRLDLLRWRGEIMALATADQLREYTYLVAGCVGEFWTRICVRKVERFSRRPIDEMLAMGRRYGCGLQLINILRDAGADLRAGRCYFPEEELRSAKILPAELLDPPERFAPIYRNWIEDAQSGIEAGVEYSLAVESARLRAATVLPALIGTRTLRLLREKGTQALRERVKVPRDEVRGIIGSLFVTLANRQRIRSMFNQLRK